MGWKVLAAGAFAGSLALQSLGAAPDEAAGAFKANLDLPFGAMSAGSCEVDVPESIVFFRQQYEGDAFFFCCDKSGSMREAGKWRRLQEELANAVSQFSSRVEFGIVFFDSGLVKFPACGKPVKAEPAIKSEAIERVLSAQPGSGTCPKAALLASLATARQFTASRKSIIFVSDGDTWCPGLDQAQYSQEVLSEVTESNVERVPIHTVNLRGCGAERWMRDLASKNGGYYVYIP